MVTSLTEKTSGRGSRFAETDTDTDTDTDTVVLSSDRRFGISTKFRMLGSKRQEPAPRTKAAPRRSTLRRLRGFVVAFEGKQARVAFVENNAITHEYFLPSRLLKEAAVNHENQPFELDEFEEKRRGEGLAIGFTVRPMADEKSLIVENFEESERLRNLRQAALAHFR